MDPVEVKFFNDPIIVDGWTGETNSYPILIIGTQSMGGYIDKGKWGGGWQPAEGDDIETKSNELKEVFNKKLASMGYPPISSLNGNVAVCNVFDFDKDPVNIPLNINPEDYKCDKPFGDTTSGVETPDVILSKIIDNSRWIYSKLREGKHVFVHCNAGASRSPTVVVKMLTNTLRVSIDQAIEIVKRDAPKMHGNDRVNIGNFKDLLLGEAGTRAVVDLEPEPDMGGFGEGAARAAPATQQEVSKEEQIRTIQEKIKGKEATIDLLKGEGEDVSSIEYEIYQLTTKLRGLMSSHSGGAKKRKSKKKKSKKRKTKRKYKRRKSKRR